MSDLLPPTVAIRIATRPGDVPGNPSLIGIALFQTREQAPGTFTYSMHLRVLRPNECEGELIYWLQHRLDAAPTLIGFHPPDVWTSLMRVAELVRSARPSFREALATMIGDPVQLARDGDQAASCLSETCAAAGIPTWHMPEEEVLAAWKKGRNIEVTAMLAADVIAVWRLWAKRERPEDKVPQLFAIEARAAWRIDDERVHAWSHGQGVLADPETPPHYWLDVPSARLSIPARAPIPTTAYIRPCDKIAEEAMPAMEGVNLPIADRYKGLTEELPLAGAAMMRANAAGEITITALLRARAPWLEPAIEVIAQQLRVQNWAGRPWFSWRPLCLTGRPGVGKSYLARLLGELSGAGSAVLDLGGVADNRTLEGTARGWTNAQPCWPAVVMSQTRTANPVLLLEEVEKAGGSERNGVPHSTLLTMVEAETAGTYWDKCLLANVNLSHCCWLMTSNNFDRLPGPLKSRIDVVEVEGPGPEHFDHIVAAVICDLAGRWNVPPSLVPDLPDHAYRTLRRVFTRHRSVRRLRRHLEQLISTIVGEDRGLTH